MNEKSADTLTWYVLRSKPRKEATLSEYVQSKGVRCFYPSMTVNPVNPRSRRVRPYFPGYLFVRVDLEELGKTYFRWMPHSLGLVRFGGEPARVPASIIRGIKKTIAALEEAAEENPAPYQAGDEVMIEDGPFSGYRAIFDAQISGEERVRVLLRMLDKHREVPLELKMRQIREVD